MDVLIIANAKHLHASEAHGPGSLVLGGGKVLGCLTEQDPWAFAKNIGLDESKIIDASNMVAVPGFVDMHVHITGGGGEAGPASRTPEAKLSELLMAGITTVVGTLGTDGISRSMDSLIIKSRALGIEGISCYFWGGGGYALPPVTLTGSIRRDIMLLKGCVGVGEVAISDHRSSQPTEHELARLAADVHVGSMLAGQTCIVQCHCGSGSTGLQPLWDALASSNDQLPISVFHPTHVGRTDQLLRDSVKWMMQGGWVDVTASTDSPLEAVEYLIENSIKHNCVARMTVSSDAYGSLPVFDDTGHLVRYDVAKPSAMLDFLYSVVHQGSCLEPSDGVKLVSCNPAKRLGLQGKGSLQVGADADVVLLSEDYHSVEFVVAKGRVMKTPEWVRGGAFETGRGIIPWEPSLSSQCTSQHSEY